jgi:hypothetical protein
MANRKPGWGLNFGHPDFFEIRFGFGLHRLWQFIQHIHGFVHPAPLLSRRAEFFLKRLPEAKRAIADGEFRRDGETTGFQIRQQPPARIHERLLLANGWRGLLSFAFNSAQICAYQPWQSAV